MKKRISLILLIIAILIALAIPASAASASQFTDVSPTAWYYQAVDYVAKKRTIYRDH